MEGRGRVQLEGDPKLSDRLSIAEDRLFLVRNQLTPRVLWNVKQLCWISVSVYGTPCILKKINVKGIKDGALGLKLQLNQNESLDYLQFKVYGNITRCVRKTVPPSGLKCSLGSWERSHRVINNMCVSQYLNTLLTDIRIFGKIIVKHPLKM